MKFDERWLMVMFCAGSVVLLIELPAVLSTTNANTKMYANMFDRVSIKLQAPVITCLK